MQHKETEAAQQGGLAAAAWPNQPGDDATTEVEAYLFESLKIAVPEVEIFRDNGVIVFVAHYSAKCA